MEGFMTPPRHVNFNAKKLFGKMGEIQDGSIAYLENGGGGPTENHVHMHDHLFIVVQGEAKVFLDKEEKIIRENESFLVKGTIPHSVWNNSQSTTIMIGISLHDENNREEPAVCR